MRIELGGDCGPVPAAMLLHKLLQPFTLLAVGPGNPGNRYRVRWRMSRQTTDAQRRAYSVNSVWWMSGWSFPIHWIRQSSALRVCTFISASRVQSKPTTFESSSSVGICLICTRAVGKGAPDRAEQRWSR